MRVIVSQRQKRRTRRQRRRRKNLEKHAPHRAVVISTKGVPTRAVIACFPGSLNEVEGAWGLTLIAQCI